MKILIALALIMTLAPMARAQDMKKALLPVDGRWMYPHFLTFRPGNGQVCDVNPPRFSWGYVPNVLMDRPDPVSLDEFHFQLSRDDSFSKPEMEVVTPYNFYNALPVLEGNTWYWRVGYRVGTKQEQWSPVRRFTIAPDAIQWDRTVIRRAAERIASRAHPRMAPEGGWQRWKNDTEKASWKDAWAEKVIANAEAITARPWWTDFPETDVHGATKYDDRSFATMGDQLVVASFAYQLTGDEKFAKAKDHFLTIAGYPRGGDCSPEFHGGRRKWPTQFNEYLALAYDWFYQDLNDEEKKVLLDAIDWRLRATFHEAHSWKMGESIDPQGVSVFPGSHPYENLLWSTPGVLMTAGDLEISDELTELCLHYLAGVTNAHGPTEAWNEGFSYGSAKGWTMLKATMYTSQLLPELNIHTNPYYERLAQWYAHLVPIGLQRLSFGDHSVDPSALGSVRRAAYMSRAFAMLTGNGRWTNRADELDVKLGNSMPGRPWLELLLSERMDLPKPIADEPKNALFPEAGWVMVNSHGPSSRKDYKESVGMIFQCRPRGAYSHSFRAENDFVWHAYGQTLSAGGGGMDYPDQHSRHSMSHNVVLINGQEQSWDPYRPEFPYVGRILAYQEVDDYVLWVGDASKAYQGDVGLKRWHRYVVFVDNQWFAMFDDLEMERDAEPARFSWLHQVFPPCPLTLSKEGPGFEYTIEGVTAHVDFAGSSDALEIVDMRDRDTFKNPVTGEDIYDRTVVILRSKGKNAPPVGSHTVWVTNRKPSTKMEFVAALTASDATHEKLDVSFPGARTMEVRYSDGRVRTVSFDPKTTADIVIDPQPVRDQAMRDDFGMIPDWDSVDAVEIDGDRYDVQWFAQEPFDDTWLTRWAVEGSSEFLAKEGALFARKAPGLATTGSIWYRQPMPDNVMIRFKTKPIPPAEENACNLNMFIHARELDGSPLRFVRSGVYGEYHQIPNYIVTFVGGIMPGWSRVRRDPGFNMVSQSKIRTEVGQEYDIVVTVVNGRLRYYVDGNKIHDYTDPEPLPGGWFGIRTWSTNAWWKDVRFGEISDTR